MAKFTAYFNGKPIQSHIFESGIIHIGRDDTNDFIIDNLAIAPAHAVAIIREGECIIKQLNDEFPLIINDIKSREALLQNNDEISIGKHTIIYSTTETVAPSAKADNNIDSKDISSLNVNLKETVKIPEASLQILDGQHIGRILPLKKSVTRLGQSGSGIAIITRSDSDFLISAHEGEIAISVNQKALGEQTVTLKNNDIVNIENVSMQFFLEN